MKGTIYLSGGTNDGEVVQLSKDVKIVLQAETTEQGEIKRTNEMIKNNQEKRIKSPDTEGLFMAFEVTPRGTNQYNTMVQRLYGMTQTETVGTTKQSRNDASGNVSKDMNGTGTVHGREAKAQSRNGGKSNLLIEEGGKQSMRKGRKGRLYRLKGNRPWSGGKRTKRCTVRKVVE